MAGTREWRLSYRWRRRAIVVAVLVAAAGGVAAAVILLPGGEHTDTSAQAGGSAAGVDAAAPPPRRVKEPPNRRPTAAEQHAIISTISLFISTAVARHHPERSFEIVDASMRERMTKKQWSTGSIPVIPFPATSVDLVQFDLFQGDRALIEVLLEPTKRSGLVRKTFQIELHRSPLHKWLVSSWVPEGISESQMDVDQPESADVIAKAANPPRLSAKWIYLPLGALVALLLTPVFFFGYQGYTGRRERKRYRQSLR
jgi:hypothetical protein